MRKRWAEKLKRQLSICLMQKLENPQLASMEHPRQLRFIPIENSIYNPDLIKRINEENCREIQLADQYQFNVTALN